MGSSEDPDLTQVQTIDNKTQQCLQQCDLQTENLTTTSSSYPSRETFAMTKEFCYVLQKVARICKEPYRKEVLQQKVALPDCCKQILELNNTLKVCNDKDHPDITIVDFKPELVDFLFNYASKNVVILKLFVKDPYYTKYLRTEKISSISFIANTGGLLGLCMGMSIVSIFELTYYLLISSITFVVECIGTKKKYYK